MKVKLRGVMVVSAALGLMAAGVSCSGETAHGGEVKCSGINSCSGTGECAAVDGSHDCSGKNSCKGKGWVHEESARDCTDQGGKVIPG